MYFLDKGIEKILFGYRYRIQSIVSVSGILKRYARPLNLLSSTRAAVLYCRPRALGHVPIYTASLAAWAASL